MGYSITTHMVYGWKLPGKLFDKDGNEINVYEDEFLPFVEGHRDIDETIIYDQMLGNYTVFGKHMTYVSSDDFDFKTIDISGLNEDSLREKFKSVFGIDAPVESAEILLFHHPS